MARPKLASNEKQTSYLPIRLKESEYRVVKILADAAGVGVSGYVRDRLLQILGLRYDHLEAKVSPKSK